MPIRKSMIYGVDEKSIAGIVIRLFYRFNISPRMLYNV
jgi:hypothetical protein